MARLDGRTAIITGAGSGIGRATARLFLAEGARVVAADRSASGLANLAQAADAGPRLVTVEADAGNDGAVSGLVDRALKDFGRLDIVYGNAGISGGRSGLMDTTSDIFLDILKVNLVGPFLLAQKAAPHMVKAGRGVILMTASVAGLRANAGGVPYSASKAGVISLAQTLAHQLYGTGVRVNAICPGLIETGMTEPIFTAARERGTDKRIGQLNPLRRHGEPEEIARTALFLASDDASYVNGQAIAVCGGLTASHPFVPPRTEVG